MRKMQGTIANVEGALEKARVEFERYKRLDLNAPAQEVLRAFRRHLRAAARLSERLEEDA